MTPFCYKYIVLITPLKWIRKMLKSLFGNMVEARRRSVNLQVARFVKNEYRHSTQHLSVDDIHSRLNSGQSIEDITKP